uniref:elongation of very long chain fatty acids protein 4-like n=1 Tax=Styela clava TaxID=7725 RepID=UPI001939D6DD|nr:elongation of very long chain fatty acids protein 4-like [Styela clava]
MSHLIHKFMDFYSWAETIADKRVADWFLIPSIIPTISIVALYLIFVKYVGPKFMANRNPYEFGMLLSAYNFALVGLNYYIMKELISASKAAKYSYICTPVKHDSYDPNEMRIANALWWYYFSKLIELLDTVFFMLRKKSRQITVLHVYHHSTMPILWWIGVKWVPGGQSFFGAMLNSAIHVMMYSYYGLAALGPQMQQYLWWKKYITMLQLGQFTLAIAHTGRSIYSGCDFPPWMHWALVGYSMSFIILFSNFYIQTYTKKSARKVRNEKEK